MCLWVALLGCVWSHASVASDPHRFRRVLLAGSCGYLYTPHTLSHLGTPDVILPITSTHWGGYPPIWHKAGITRMLGPWAGIGLCCCRWPSWLWPGGSMLYRIGNSSPIPPHGSPESIYGLGPRIQQLIGQPPQCWVGVGIVAGRCCSSHRGWATGGWVVSHI